MDADTVRAILLKDDSIMYILNVYGSLMSKHFGERYTISREDVNGIINTIEKMDSHFLENDSIQNQQHNIAKIFKDQLLRSKRKNDVYYEGSDSSEDIGDIMRKTINHTSETNAERTRLDLDWGTRSNGENSVACNNFMGWTDGWSLMNALNPRSIEKTYPTLMLDTRNRNRADSDPSSRKNMQWEFYPGSRWSDGTVNGIGPIRDIVSIECGTIYFPNVDDQSFVEYRQISMLIHEFTEQASILSDKVRFHFLFNAEVIPDDAGTERLKLTPAFNGACETRFSKPITTLTSFTVSFGTPAERITFGHDYDPSPSTVTKGNPTVFTTSIAHSMSNGDLVYLEEFTTGDTTADGTLIRLANRERGHIIQNVTSTTFEIAALDSSSATGTASVARIIFGSRRFFIPLKLTYLSGKTEEY